MKLTHLCGDAAARMSWAEWKRGRLLPLSGLAYEFMRRWHAFHGWRGTRPWHTLDVHDQAAFSKAVRLVMQAGKSPS